MQDSQIVFSWYLILLAFTIVGLPLTSYLFKNWTSKGIVFAKVVGLVIIGFPIWLLSSLKIIPFSQEILIIYLIIAVLTALFFIYKTRFRFTRRMLFLEAVFLLVFCFWALIRSYNPEIIGTEKFMNLAFMNSIANSDYFPALDPWFVGGNINYYYLGHYFFTLIGKTLGISMEYSYNLALATVSAQLVVAVTAIIARLIQTLKNINFLTSERVALFTAILVAFGGNVHYIYSLITSVVNNQQFNYFFPDPTRIIPFAIDEFPAYSIVLGDLHGHFLVLPFTLLVIALIVESSLRKKINLNKYIFNALISLFFVMLYGINSWDFITILVAFTMLHFYQAFRLKTKLKAKIFAFIKLQFSILLPGIILIFPYIANFVAPIGGLGFVPADKRSPIEPWLLMWGYFLIVTILFLLLLFKLKIGKKFYQVKLLLKIKEVKKISPIIFIFSILVFGLIIGVEFIFIKDIFYQSNPPYFRTNTVFKFYYHAWIIWGILSGYFIYFSLKHLQNKLLLILYKIIIILIFITSISYIYKAIKDFYPIDPPRHTVTLDGKKYLEEKHKGDFDAINWLTENVNKETVILEAVGDAYTYSARISTHTGIPTVVGWPTHQWQWRGDSVIPFARKSDVETIYTTSNQTLFAEKINQYKIKYIVVGNDEKTKYPNWEKGIIKSLDLVFESNGTKIFQLD